MDQAGDGDACIVDEDVEATFGLLDAGDDGRPFALAGDIVRHETRLAARLADRSGDVFTHHLNIREDDAGALSCEHFRRSAADTAGGSGDEGNLARNATPA